MNLWAIFLTGLFTGGLTCLAVQGGLLASTIASREEERLREKAISGSALPILAFLGAKLIAYTLLGLLLGYLGSLVQLSLTTRTILQFAVVTFMIGTALNLLRAHPIFRYFVIQPPRFLTRLIRQQTKSQDIFAPTLLGAFTVFIPCGTTQAMMALAIASGNPLVGASILFVFVLGTSPLFFIFGYFATKLGDLLQQKFMKVAAIAILLLAVFNLDGALALSGIEIRGVVTNVFCTAFCINKPASVAQQTNGSSQEATINIQESGYDPNNISIKAGSQITLNIVNKGGSGCTQTFTIPRLGLQKTVPLGTKAQLAFVAPNEPGTTLSFMCSMGMFRGKFNII